MPDKYDAMIDAALAAPAGRDRYDDLIDSALQDAVAQPTQPSFASRAAGFLAEEGTPVAGAMLGAAASLPYAPLAGPLAPLVPVAGAAMGAMGARGLQRTLQYATGQREVPTTAQAAQDIASAGVGGATGEVGGQFLGRALQAGARAAGPTLRRLGAQALRVGPGVQEKYGGAVLRDPTILTNPVTKADVSQAYSQFEKSAGLVSPKTIRLQSGKILESSGDAEKIVDAVYSRLASGAGVAEQDLYTASQAASYLKNQAKFGDPKQLANLSNLATAKTAFDNALELATAGGPSYAAARTAAFREKAAGEFSSFYPLNKNLSPNVLRSVGATGAAAAGAVSGNYGALGIPFLISPRAAGAAIKTTYRVGQAVGAVGPAGTRLGAQSLADAYMNQ